MLCAMNLVDAGIPTLWAKSISPETRQRVVNAAMQFIEHAERRAVRQAAGGDRIVKLAVGANHDGAVVRCLQHPVAEVYPHRKSRGLTIINALAPGFTDGLVRKYGRRREQ